MPLSQHVPTDLKSNLVETIRLAYTELCFILFHHPPFEQDPRCIAFLKALEQAYVSVCFVDDNGRTQFDYNQIVTDQDKTRQLLKRTSDAWHSLWAYLDESTQDNIYHLWDLMEALKIDPLQRPPPLPGASPPNVYTFTNRPQNTQLGNMLARLHALTQAPKNFHPRHPA